jgi:hypothetical protein
MLGGTAAQSKSDSRHRCERSRRVARESIQEGFEVFVSDHDKAFGAVRAVEPHGRAEIVVYVENAGDFSVPLDAVTAVHSGKVIVDRNRLEARLRRAIAHAHDAEDPNI